MKNLGAITDPKDIITKEYLDEGIGKTVNTLEDNLTMAESDIESLQTDIGTLQTDNTATKAVVKTLQDTYVPNTRKINNKALDADITLGASDVGAATQVTYITTIGTVWTEQTGYVQQTIIVNGILATDNPIVDLITNTSDFEAQQEAWGNIFKITTAINSITLYASEATKTAIDIQLKVVR